MSVLYTLQQHSSTRLQMCRQEMFQATFSEPPSHLWGPTNKHSHFPFFQITKLQFRSPFQAVMTSRGSWAPPQKWGELCWVRVHHHGDGIPMAKSLVQTRTQFWPRRCEGQFLGRFSSGFKNAGQVQFLFHVSGCSYIKTEVTELLN